MESAGSGHSCGRCWSRLQSSLHQQVAIQLSGQLLLQSNTDVQAVELTPLSHSNLQLVLHTRGGISGGFTAVYSSLCMHACIMPNVLPYRAEGGQSDNLSLQFKDDLFNALINALAA